MERLIIAYLAVDEAIVADVVVVWDVACSRCRRGAQRAEGASWHTTMVVASTRITASTKLEPLELPWQVAVIDSHAETLEHGHRHQI
jgi:Flp pilus assembly protein CpaB